MIDIDVATALAMVLAYLAVIILFYYRIKRLFAKLGARKVSQAKEGSLNLVVWNDVHNRTERLSVNTTVPLGKPKSVIRAVQLWGIVRRKSIIEIAEAETSKILFRTY